MFVSEVRHIGKESDVLNKPFGLDEFSYEFYDDPERVDREFKENNIRSQKKRQRPSPIDFLLK